MMNAVDTLIPAPDDAYNLILSPATVSVDCSATGAVAAHHDIEVVPHLYKGEKEITDISVLVSGEAISTGYAAAVVGKVIHVYSKFMAWKNSAGFVLYTPKSYPDVPSGTPAFDSNGRLFGNVTSSGTVYIKIGSSVQYTGYLDGNIETVSENALFTVDVKDNKSGATVSTKLQVCRNRQGEQGPQGPEGLRPIPVPAGEYSSTASYTATAYVAPYVLCEGKYYVLNKQGTFTDVNPKTDYAANGTKATWLYLENVQYVFTEILMANLALLGKAVFYGKYMYSQYGKKKDGTAVTTSGGYGAPVESGGDFVPNLLIDFLSGSLRCKSVDIEGKVNATSGTFSGTVNATAGSFGNMTISGNGFTNPSGVIRFIEAGSGYLDFRTTSTTLSGNPMLYAWNASGGPSAYFWANTNAPINVQILGGQQALTVSGGKVHFTHGSYTLSFSSTGLAVKYGDNNSIKANSTSIELCTSNTRLVISSSDPGNIKIYTKQSDGTWQLKKTL